MADSLDVISAATGIGRAAMQEIWDDVGRNNALLNSCQRHLFECLEPHRLGSKWRCSACGGTVSGSAAHWYNLGRRHG